jgi:hypothetical protein
MLTLLGLNKPKKPLINRKILVALEEALLMCIVSLVSIIYFRKKKVVICLLQKKALTII